MRALVREETSGEMHPLGDVSLIGRGEGASIRLSDPSVSRQHASIRFEEASFWVVDLGSANGTFVNGVALKAARALRDGDRIQFGKAVVVFELGGHEVQQPTSPLERTQISRLAGEMPRSERATILVADIKGFTSLSAQLSASEVAALLRDWYADCDALLKRHGASIDSFIGDCVFAYWHGAGPAERFSALGAAAALRRIEPSEASTTRALLADRGGVLECRVGLHVGQVAVGAMGKGISTALGSAVNLAFRLEGLTRALDRSVLVSGAFVSGLPEGYARFEPCGRHPVKGLAEPIEVFAPVLR